MPLLPPIPGYAEAVKKERDIRNSAFLPANETIAGRPAKPLTMNHVLVLDAVRSPFMEFRPIELHDLPVAVSIFLWIVSPQWKPFSDDPEQNRKDRAEHFRFMRSLRKTDFLTAAGEIDTYIGDAFFDAPGGNGNGAAISHCSWVATISAILSNKLNTTPEEIRNTPLKQIWQYLRATSNKPLINPSDRIRSDWLRDLNAGKFQLPGRKPA